MSAQANSAAVKAHAVDFVHEAGVVRWSTLVRLLEWYLGAKSPATWSTYVSRLVRDSDLMFMRPSNGKVESIIAPDSAAHLPIVEVQAAHELRAADVAVEFLREGFAWTPPLTPGARDSKVSDGTAWLGEMRYEVEIELSPKTAKRWASIIQRYRDAQAREPVGVIYVFAHDGLRRSFRKILAKFETPGFWYLAVANMDSTEARQALDSSIARACRDAADSGQVFATAPSQPELFTARGTPTVEATPGPEFKPEPALSRQEEARRRMQQLREGKGQNDAN